MRTILMKSAAAISAIVVAASLGACAPSNAETAMVDGKLVTVTSEGKVIPDTAALDQAEAGRAAAEARAAAAEAKAECEKERQNASNTGAVIGGVTGAVIGSQVAGHGAKSEGGAIGAVAGVMTGRQIAKKDHRC